MPESSKHRKYLMIFTISAFIFVVIELIVYIQGKPDFMLGTIYTLFGIGFLVYGVIILQALEKNFARFYFKQRCKLIVATSLLCIPITVFGIM